MQRLRCATRPIWQLSTSSSADWNTRSRTPRHIDKTRGRWTRLPMNRRTRAECAWQLSVRAQKAEKPREISLRTKPQCGGGGRKWAPNGTSFRLTKPPSAMVHAAVQGSRDRDPGGGPADSESLPQRLVCPACRLQPLHRRPVWRIPR